MNTFDKKRMYSGIFSIPLIISIIYYVFNIGEFGAWQKVFLIMSTALAIIGLRFFGPSLSEIEEYRKSHKH